MRLRVKISFSSAVLAVCAFVSAFFISDNESITYKIIVALISLIIFTLASAAATGVGFVLQKLAYQLYGTITGTSEYDPEKPYIHEKIFRKRFFIAFLILTFGVFLKFLTDFLFSQHSAIYLFFTGACGVFNSGFVTNILARHKKADINVLKK